MSLSGDTALFTPMDTEKIPASVLKTMRVKTEREFKQLKRAELREVKKAIGILRRGCAFMPLYNSAIETLDATVERWIEECGVKRWGR